MPMFISKYWMRGARTQNPKYRVEATLEVTFEKQYKQSRQVYFKR